LSPSDGSPEDRKHSSSHAVRAATDQNPRHHGAAAHRHYGRLGAVACIAGGSIMSILHNSPQLPKLLDNFTPSTWQPPADDQPAAARPPVKPYALSMLTILLHDRTVNKVVIEPNENRRAKLGRVLYPGKQTSFSRVAMSAFVPQADIAQGEAQRYGIIRTRRCASSRPSCL
jgi:hypothetical protein